LPKTRRMKTASSVRSPLAWATPLSNSDQCHGK
jgi:hypothetical protein